MRTRRHYIYTRHFMKLRRREEEQKAERSTKSPLRGDLPQGDRTKTHLRASKYDPGDCVAKGYLRSEAGGMPSCREGDTTGSGQVPRGDDWIQYDDSSMSLAAERVIRQFF